MNRNRTLSIAFLLGALMLLPAVPAQARGFRWGWGGWGGWGWGGWGWGYPGYGYAYGGYGYPYGYGYGGDRRASFARVKTDVDPEEARLYLDGRVIGTADDFDGYPDYLYLKRGHYRLEFRLDGYESKTIDVDAEPGITVRIDSKLKKIPGAKHYGSYDEVKIEGGIHRYFAKRRDAAARVDPSMDARPDSDSDNYTVGRDRRDGNGEIEQPSGQDWRDSRPRGSASPQTSTSARAQKSRLSMKVSPSDAAVYVDDRFVGTAEEVGSLQSGLAVSSGKHTVTASRPGFQDQSMDVQIEPGATESVEISLKH